MKKLLTGRIVSKETGEKISKSKAGKPLSTIHKDSISKTLLGHETSLYTRKKIGLSNKGKQRTPEHKFIMTINKFSTFDEKSKFIKDLLFVLDNLNLNTNEILKRVNISRTIINRIKKNKTHWILNVNNEILNQYL